MRGVLVGSAVVRVRAVHKFLSCPLQRVAGARDAILAVLSELARVFDLVFALLGPFVGTEAAPRVE